MFGLSSGETILLVVCVFSILTFLENNFRKIHQKLESIENDVANIESRTDEVYDKVFGNSDDIIYSMECTLVAKVPKLFRTTKLALQFGELFSVFMTLKQLLS